MKFEIQALLIFFACVIAIAAVFIPWFMVSEKKSRKAAESVLRDLEADGSSIKEIELIDLELWHVKVEMHNGARFDLSDLDAATVSEWFDRLRKVADNGEAFIAVSAGGYRRRALVPR